MVDLFESNIPFVHYWAKRYHVADVDYDDLVQEGLIGLMEAVNKYDPDKGRFIDYAFPWIRGRMLDALEASVLIKLPSDVYKQVQRIRKSSIRLTQELLKTPTTEDIANDLQIPVDRVIQLIEFVRPIVSMDEDLTETASLSTFLIAEAL